MKSLLASIIGFLMSNVLIHQAVAQPLDSIPQNQQKAQIEVPKDNTPTTKNQDDPSGFEPFGSNLFTGNFSAIPFTGFNPDYQIAVGDQIIVRIWGAVDFDQVLTVDPQGNIFIPKIGPIRVLNVRNEDLNSILGAELEKIYLKNVGIYTSLNTNQSVKVYVTGFVKSPGLYAGLNTDSVMSYIDKAKGIDPLRGSYIDIHVLRNGQLIKKVNLYDFILAGKVPPIQFHDGDTILVNSRTSTVRVNGFVQNQNTFEIGGDSISLEHLVELAKILPEASHIRITRNQGDKQIFDYFPLAEKKDKKILKADVIEFMSDKQKENIAIRVEGEHASAYEYVVPPGTSLASLLSKINFTSLSDQQNIQLFRRSVKAIQKERLKASLEALEQSILGAQSSSKEEAEIRAREADMVMKLIEKAKKVEPKGQVVLTDKIDYSEVLLEAGDVINIPQKSNVVMIHGEVYFPNAIIYRDGFEVEDYIEQAGGFTHRANTSQVVVLRRSGSFATQSSGFFSKSVEVKPGDEIFVMPQVDTKSLQITKDVFQILYQLAITTKVALTI